MRVRTAYVDRLMELVGELAIVQSIVAQDATVTRAADGVLDGKLRHAEKIARELQRLSMSMRMVPLKGLFQRLNRVTRDVAARTGKSVAFRTAGGDTEIDRSMVDALNDPLVHMVRNAVDHGLETVEERRAGGKSDQGTVTLSASHVGGNVVIELADDGRGLDRERIAAKAVERGLVSAADGLSDEEVHRLIFAPGFTTADAVTNVSGRGVGMDVVRHNIEALRGRIEIGSVPGQGTRFTLRLPLTLAISDGMLVRVGGERFIVPTLAIQLSFRPTRAGLVTVAGTGEAVMLRDELLPLVRLHRAFAVSGAVEDPAQAVVMVVGDGIHRAALLVDELLGQQQVVVKSLGSGIAHAPGISGGAILGDGRVGLILDVGSLLAVARRSVPPAAEPSRHGRAVA
jgi:two-component system chemotaxis sensor kinase CheA